MNSPTRLYLRLAGEVRGPLQLEQLREMAEAGVIMPTTESALSAAGPWMRLDAQPLYPTLFPPRPELRFKATEFEAVNRRSVPPVDHRELIAWANLPPPPGLTTAAGPAAPAPPKPEPVNEVLEIVREVARVDQLHAPPMVFPTRRRLSRRVRHYLIAAAISNSLLVAVALYYHSFDDEMSRAIIMGWIALFNGGLAAILLTMGSVK